LPTLNAHELKRWMDCTPELFMTTATINNAPPPAKPLSPWQFWGRIMVLPYLLIFAVFVLYPVSYGLWLARSPANYIALADDPIFFRTAINTVVFLLLAVNLKMIVALGLSGFFVQTRWWIKACRCCSSCPGRCRRSPPSCRCASC
jgi:multiple sugar transport system permease protein